MNIITNITLDLTNNLSPPTVFAKQGDNESRSIIISLLNNSNRYSPENGVTITIKILKPDGFAILNDAEVNDDGTIILKLSAQMLAVPGLALAEITLVKDNVVLSTPIFYIKIEPCAVTDSQIESSSEFKTLINMLNEATQAVQTANNASLIATTASNVAESYAEKSETASNAAQAAQNAAETAKSEVMELAESAGKAAENAAQSETAAKTSADNAAGSALTAENFASSAKTSANRAAQYKLEISEYMSALPQFSYDSETETLTITTAG